MTTWQSLLYCAAADVTLERIKNLIAVTGTEPLTVDFKEGGATPVVAECAAAMANAHGGLILVGITDRERDIVGVSRGHGARRGRLRDTPGVSGLAARDDRGDPRR
jgi:hypothetical protein